MLRPAAILALALALAGSDEARSESLRQFHSETSTPVAELAAHLDAQLPDTATVLQASGTMIVTYAGNATPAPLARFLEAAFEGFDATTIAPGQTVSLNLSGTGYEGTTALSLVILARLAAPGAPIPDGAQILLDGTGPGDCEGQLVLQYPGRRKDARPAMRSILEQAGFDFSENDPGETSFFIGQAPGCSLALYLRPKAKTTLIVLRYLED